ncbi:MAG: hydrogenase [Chloroflexi bacterium]|nr:hydrogenase [Chloroflexota bacterium]
MPSSSLTLQAAVAGLVVVAVLLTQLDLLRAFEVGEPVTLYAVQSFFIAVFAAAVGLQRGDAGLLVIAALTLVVKVWLVRKLLRAVIARARVGIVIPMVINVPLSLLIGLVLTGIAFIAAQPLPLAGQFLPRSALAASFAILLIGFQVMATRQHVVTQIVALLTQENGGFLATIAIAPGLPPLVAVLILFDVLIAVVVFGVLVRLLNARADTATTERLTQLQG